MLFGAGLGLHFLLNSSSWTDALPGLFLTIVGGLVGLWGFYELANPNTSFVNPGSTEEQQYLKSTKGDFVYTDFGFSKQVVIDYGGDKYTHVVKWKDIYEVNVGVLNKGKKVKKYFEVIYSHPRDIPNYSGLTTTTFYTDDGVLGFYQFENKLAEKLRISNLNWVFEENEMLKLVFKNEELKS